MAISFYHSGMLSELALDASTRQQESIETITTTVMDAVIDQTMTRETELEAYIADEMFRSLEIRVKMLGEYAQKLLQDPDGHPRESYSGPDPEQNGTIVTQTILAEGVDGKDPILADKIGLAANMSDLMVSLFGVSAETNSCFIALPEGAFLVTDDRSASKFEQDGTPSAYDPRTRPWYQLAVDKGDLIYTDVEVDAFTGDIGIVCAMPVYVEGELAAVVGSDLFLTSMQEAISSSDENGTFLCVINPYGHVVFSPKTEGEFRVRQSSEAVDLRQSEQEDLARIVSCSLQEKTGLRRVSLPEGDCFIVGVPMKTVGWSLLSICSLEAAGKPTEELKRSYGQIQEEVATVYQEKTEQLRKTMAVFLNCSVFSLTALFIRKKHSS